MEIQRDMEGAGEKAMDTNMGGSGGSRIWQWGVPF